MLIRHIIILLSLVALQTTGPVCAQQADPYAACLELLSYPFSPDGQVHIAQLEKGDYIDFDVTFYGQTVYRLIACSGCKEAQVSFSLYDQEGHLLFCNADYRMSPYWDFDIQHTLHGSVRLELSSETETPCTVYLIVGFR